MSDLPPDLSNDPLFGLLRASIPPIPRYVAEAGRRAWAARDPDAQLAQLIIDSAATAGLRSAGVLERLLVFAVGETEISVHIRSVDAALAMVDASAEFGDFSESGGSDGSSGSDGQSLSAVVRVEVFGRSGVVSGGRDGATVSIQVEVDRLLRVMALGPSGRIRARLLRTDTERPQLKSSGLRKRVVCGCVKRCLGVA